MYTTIAYFESTAAGATNDQINALTGTAEFVQNNRHVLDADAFLAAAYVQGASLTRARINAPTFRRIVLPHVRPITRAAAPADLVKVADFRKTLMRLKAREEIALETSNDLAMGTENHHGILFVHDGVFNVPKGDPVWMRATGTTTLTANAWTNVTLTFDEQLPAGDYEIIGMNAFSANAVAARLVFPGVAGPRGRPGVIGISAIGNRTWPMFENGEMGSMGRFVTTALPSVEYLASAADTAQTVFLQILKIA